MKVIILHGWLQNKDIWSGFTNKMGKDAFCLEMPGFGSEKAIDTNWGVPEYTNWVINKIKDYKNVILIGHSFGGRITAEIASKNPKWLHAIVLSGAPCLYRPTFKTRFKIRFYKIIKNFIPKMIRSLFFTKDLTKARQSGLENVFRNVVNYDQISQLQKINIPSLLIWGQNDLSVPLYVANEINKSIKHSKLEVINNAGHNSFLDNPNLFYGYVKKFIDNV